MSVLGSPLRVALVLVATLAMVSAGVAFYVDRSSPGPDETVSDPEPDVEAAQSVDTGTDVASLETAEVVVTTNLRMRAGPSSEHPVVVVVTADSAVELLGCVKDYTWCEVRFRGDRGWMSAQYLEVYEGGRLFTIAQYARGADLPVLRFDKQAYWSKHYRNRPFYADGSSEPVRRRSSGIQVGVFYERLSPHGSWVSLRDQYVWVPEVDSRWRPYTRGRWVHTRRYGWMWVSDEPFGWATYHYGRWGYSHRIGWFWIPGDRWAPAWVAWRQSGDHLAWAPLPPDSRAAVSITVTIGDIPDYYWQTVPTRAFLSVDLSKRIVRDPARRRDALRQTKPAGNVTVEKNIVVNNVIEVPAVEKHTQERVVTHDVVLTDKRRRDGPTSDQKLEIYHPSDADAATVTAPPEVKPIEVVERESQTKTQAADQPSTEELVPPPLVQEEKPAPTLKPPAQEAVGAPEPEAAEPVARDEPVTDTCPEGAVRRANGTCRPTPETKKEKRRKAEEPSPAAEPSTDVCPEGTPRNDDGTCRPASDTKEEKRRKADEPLGPELVVPVDTPKADPVVPEAEAPKREVPASEPAPAVMPAEPDVPKQPEPQPEVQHAEPPPEAPSATSE